MDEHYGYEQQDLAHYTCYRAAGPIVVDGKLNEASWLQVPKSPRFEDLEEKGRPALFDTRAALVLSQLGYAGLAVGGRPAGNDQRQQRCR
jgi:hypothetical protein